MARPFYVYMLRCSDGSYYVGQTDDLEKRYTEHQTGGKCVYTSARRPVELVWSAEFPTRIEAKEFEARLKRWSRAKKQALIDWNEAALHQASEKRDWDGYRKRSQERDAGK
jgi:predicted GIY-YIG superfamily endonuclease